MTTYTHDQLFALATSDDYAPATAPLEVVAVHSRLAVEIGMASDNNISADFAALISAARKGVVSKHIKAQIALAYNEQAAANEVIKAANKVLKATIKAELAKKNPKMSKKDLDKKATDMKNEHPDFQKTTQGVYAAYCVAARRGYEKAGYKFIASKDSYKLEKLAAKGKGKAEDKASDSSATSPADGGMTDHDERELTMAEIRAFIINKATITQQAELAELISDLATGKAVTA